MQTLVVGATEVKWDTLYLTTNHEAYKQYVVENEPETTTNNYTDKNSLLNDSTQLRDIIY